jgi:hypothetical protein
MIYELLELLWVHFLRTYDFLALLAYRLNKFNKFASQIFGESFINHLRVFSDCLSDAFKVLLLEQLVYLVLQDNLTLMRDTIYLHFYSLH